MKLIPTFVDAGFYGYLTLKELNNLRAGMYGIARERQKEKQADHVIYCHYDLEKGEIRAAWMYTGMPMTDEEFDRVANLKHAFIGAIHKLK